jgi:assimilatory nitrate reductase catalytic subunit
MMADLREVSTTCPYCGVGCGVLATTDGAQIVSVRGDPQHPANFGKLCSKGSTLHLTARAGGRVLQPLLRADRDTPRAPVSWDRAIETVADRFAAIIAAHGPDAVAFYGSGQLLTEDYYALNKLARGVVGTNNIDTNSRLCMSSAVAGYKATLGSDAVPTCYDDIDSADLLFIAGSNTAWAHPIVYRRIEAAKQNRPHQRTIVVDPRRTETAAQADLHLALLPGTDVALFHAMLHWLVWEERVDTAFIDAHTEGFAELKRAVREMSPVVAARVCGLPVEDIITAAQWWAESGNVLSLYCQGLNQSSSGTAKNAALVGLHLATQQIGKVGAGPFSLTGQPNAMGGREVGALANLLPGHREAANATHRDEVAKLWGIDALPAVPGKTAVEMFDAIKRGEIKAVWIACTNPAHSMPDLKAVHAALRTAEFVVVQEAFASSETVAFADLVLPASTWGEKSGTVTNSERRITRVNAALKPPGEARDDWTIFSAIGRVLEKRLHPARPSVMTFDSAQSVWEEHRSMTEGRDLDITGLSYAMLDSAGPQQWPYPRGASATTPRLYTDKRFARPNGKAQFAATPYRPVAEPTTSKFPLALTTGRLRDQWHTMTRTGRSATLFGHTATPELAMHPDDLTRRGIAQGALVRVRSARGAFVAQAQKSDEIRSGQAYLPMHWGSGFVGGRDAHGMNALTSPAFCPQSKQPELKHAAVHVEALKETWTLAAFAYVPAAQLDDARAAWLAHCAQLDFAVVIPVEGQITGLYLHAAALEAPTKEWLSVFDTALIPESATALSYDDAHASSGRRVWVRNDCVQAARLSGPTARAASALWLRTLMLQRTPIAPLSRWLLAPMPPTDQLAPSSRVVCTCFGVREDEIKTALGQAQGKVPERLAEVQRQLRCGTNCGSCMPELKQLAQRAITDERAPA